MGVRLASTPYVGFADDDSWWAPDVLRTAADVLDSHPRLAVPAARILVVPEERIDRHQGAGQPLNRHRRHRLNYELTPTAAIGTSEIIRFVRMRWPPCSS